MSEQVRADFDRLALLDTDEWDHNGHYQPLLLRSLPERRDAALEIGCGTGQFSRILARKFGHVTGIDLSPEMIRIGGESSAGFTNIDYRVQDVMAWELPDESLDCIASIATLHHLPLDVILDKAKRALRPGGSLLVLDLFEAETVSDILLSLMAIPVNAALRWWKTGRVRESAEVRAAWAAHGIHDYYLTLKQVRETCQQILPGAQVRRHLLWRYSVVWKKLA